MITETALTVSQLNTYIKMMFEGDNRLQHICVVGEISNFVNHYKTGHCYFSLKDGNAIIKAVMFAGNARRLRFAPENGMRVFITGRVSVFERDGVYQIYADTMEPEGAGALMIAFEQLKKKLFSEGLFDDNRKRSLPEFPHRIGVITSPVGAAVQDIKNVLSRRYPLAEMVFCPVAVQGINCANENIRAIKLLNFQKNIDVIILGRGGGSIEDLWGYNDEQLVRAVADSDIPIITGIGHETDFTLCDFASDMRAPTPSAAAEISVPDIDELYQITDSYILRLENSAQNYFELKYSVNENLKRRLELLDPESVLEKKLSDCENFIQRMKNVINAYFEKQNTLLAVTEEKLKLLNPASMLDKGFIAVYNNQIRIRRASELSVDDKIKLEFADGSAVCKVDEITISEQ